MGFCGRFQDHILPDKVHILNVSFTVPALRREFGGCAGNIAYNIKLLGGQAKPLASVGEDFAPYLNHLLREGIDTSLLQSIPDKLTAQAFIITDMQHNQVTAFHPGAMDDAMHHGIVTEGITLASVSPNEKNAMCRHAAELKAAGIPFLFDPGQAIGLFNSEELRTAIGQSTWLAVNDYEASLITRATGWSLEKIAHMMRGVIMTQGAKGSLIIENGIHTEIGAEKATAVIDPTGCGDAYRGGVLFALAAGESLVNACKLGAKMGALKIAVTGGQNHRLPANFGR